MPPDTAWALLLIVLWRWVVVTLSCRGAVTVACVWDVRRGKFLRTIDNAHSSRWCSHVDFLVSPSPDVVVSCSWGDGRIKVLSVGDGRHMATLQGNTAQVNCMVMCGDRLIKGGSDGSIKEWNVAEATCVHTK